MPEPLPNIAVRMVRPHLRDIPQAPFPHGFGIRALRRDEGWLWTEVQRDTERLFPIADDLFMRQFGDDLPGVEQRCFFVTDARGDAVGTISAWHPPQDLGPDWGRIHWVAVCPAYQGRGLGKAALHYALSRLAEWHQRAVLDTSTARVPAVKMYLDFGFVPDLDRPGADEAWRLVRAALPHPALAVAGI